jgi:hypothetical protein
LLSRIPQEGETGNAPRNARVRSRRDRSHWEQEPGPISISMRSYAAAQLAASGA